MGDTETKRWETDTGTERERQQRQRQGGSDREIKMENNGVGDVIREMEPASQVWGSCTRPQIRSAGSFRDSTKLRQPGA